MAKRKKRRGVTIEKREHFDRASIEHIASSVPVTTIERKPDGPYSFIQYRERQIQRENPGLPLIEANRIAMWEGPEAEEADANQKREARLEASNTRVGASMLQRENRIATKGGGGGGSRRKKKGSWICPVHHLEYCADRPKRGRPTGSRKEVVSARVSVAAKAALGSAAGAVLEMVGRAIAEGRTYADVVASFQRTA